MTINQVLLRLTEENREGASPEAVARWCGEVDGWLRRKVWRRTPETAGRPGYLFPEDGDRTLLVTGPWEGLYFYYACAKIDLDKREYAAYQNEIGAYNALLGDYARYYNRTTPPHPPGKLRVLD